MKMTEVPCATSRRSVANRLSASWGVSTAVGSSSIKDARAAVERFQDLDPLALADGEIGDPCMRVDRQPRVPRQRLQPGERLRPASHRRRHRLAAEHDVVEHGEVAGEREVLVHHADAGGERRPRVAGRQGAAEELDLPRIGDVVAEQDRHQRRLAGAVFAQQRQHLAGMQVERDRRRWPPSRRSAW